MTWPSWKTVLGSWRAVLALLPLLALVGVVVAGVVWVRSLQGDVAKVAAERDTAQLALADIAVARQATARELAASAYGQALLKDQVVRLKRAVSVARPIVVIHGDTGPLQPLAPEAAPLAGANIATDVQLWETKGKAVGLLGTSRLELDGKVLLAGAWKRELSSAEIAKLAPPPGLGVVLQLDAGMDLRVGVALKPWRLWGSHQLELAIMAPPVPVDGRPVHFDIRRTSASLTVR